MHEITMFEEVAIYAIAIVGALLLFGKAEPDCVVVKAAPPAIVAVEVVVESVTPRLASQPIRLLPPAVEVEAIAMIEDTVDSVGSGINTAEFVPLSEAAFHYALSRLYCHNQAASILLGMQFWARASLIKVGYLTAAKVISRGHALAVIEVAVEPEPNWEEMNTDQLRKDCTQHGIRWRNAYGNRHLKKSEMIEMLKEAYTRND